MLGVDILAVDILRLTPRKVCGEIDECKSAGEAKNGRLEKQPYPCVGKVFETSLTSWNSFNVHLASFSQFVVASFPGSHAPECKH